MNIHESFVCAPGAFFYVADVSGPMAAIHATPPDGCL